MIVNSFLQMPPKTVPRSWNSRPAPSRLGGHRRSVCLTPPHRHSGPVFGYMLEGEMIFELEGRP